MFSSKYCNIEHFVHMYDQGLDSGNKVESPPPQCVTIHPAPKFRSCYKDVTVTTGILISMLHLTGTSN
jgi:hypothetical protein